MHLKHYTSLLLFTVLFVFSSCKKDDDNIDSDNENPTSETSLYFVDSTYLASYSALEIKILFAQTDNYTPEIAEKLIYDLDVYKLTYTTEYLDGSEIIASGLIIVPKTSDSLKVLSYQHGTINDKSLAPSNFSESLSEYAALAVFASTGYITIIADYIGYGSTENLDHPYEHGPSLASASRDMIRGSFEFLDSKSVIYNSNLYITGYSEGATASIALHSLLQNSHKNEFTVAAASFGAGAYDKTQFMKYILNIDEELNFISNYFWVLNTYNSVYDINNDYSYYYNDPFATQIASEGPYASISTKNPRQIFQPSFIQRMNDGSETDLLNAIANNDYYDFVPNCPVLLTHGTEDDFVPYFNTDKTYNNMLVGNADVTLNQVQGGDHFTSIVSFHDETLNFFESH